MQEDFTDKTDNQSNIYKLEGSKDGIYELKLTKNISKDDLSPSKD